ncbi:hypothetical protein ACGF1Z_10730 [Streptomyces sp. NPDC048018]|uniref:hypothetical protein n=1 Tax=Streptomyces sp. NPDC048018 TaxID=3365499 RepID=UPI00371978D2
MTTRIARGLAGAALVMALAAASACGGGDEEGDPQGITPDASTTTSDPAQGDTLGKTFPGKGGGGQAAPVRVPTAPVGETTGGKVKVHNASPAPMNFDAPQTDTDDPDMGDAAADLGSCDGTLAPGAECAMNLQFTPYQAGTYSGTMSFVTSQGETVTVPFSGEAVSNAPTESETSGPTPTTEPTGPETPTDTPTDTPADPSPYET